MSSVVVTMHSGFCEQYVQSQGRVLLQKPSRTGLNHLILKHPASIKRLWHSLQQMKIGWFADLADMLSMPVNMTAAQVLEGLKAYIGPTYYWPDNHWPADQDFTMLTLASIMVRHNANSDVIKYVTMWWRHQMETFSALLPLCAGNSPVTGVEFDVFFDLRLNKGLSKHSRRNWFETP